MVDCTLAYETKNIFPGKIFVAFPVIPAGPPSRQFPAAAGPAVHNSLLTVLFFKT